MKAVLFALFLLLSLPNLMAGTACLILRQIIATRGLFQLLINLVDAFCFQINWGLPLAGLLIVLLLVLGSLPETQRYAAMFAFVLNGAALGIFLFYAGPPTDSGQVIVFLPVVIALCGFAWIGYSRRVAAPEL